MNNYETLLASLRNSRDPSRDWALLLSREDRWTVIETLRQAAVASLRTGGGKLALDRAGLADEESLAMQRQLELVDRSVERTLSLDGNQDKYMGFSRPDDPDFPDDPSKLSDWRIAYRYALHRTYRKDFDLAFEHQKAGCWALLTSDLLDPLDGKRILLIEKIPAAVKQHASSDFIEEMNLAEVIAIRKLFQSVRANAAQRLAQIPIDEGPLGTFGKGKIIAKVLEKIIDWAVRIDFVAGPIQEGKEAIEKAIRERAEQKERERIALQERKAREQYDRYLDRVGGIRGASDHVDHFDRNRDRISRTC